jgi:drug/metabolite transporter (DMT)-like permease
VSTNNSAGEPHGDPRRLYPVFAMLAGATMWGVIWYPMRLLEDRGVQGAWLTFALYFVAFAVSLPWTLRRMRELARRPVLVLALAVTAGWTNVAFIEAVLHGNVLRILLLFYLSPLWAALFGWLLLREKISLTSLLSLGVAMIGAVIMLWNPEAGVPWPQDRYDWLAMSSGFAFALSNVAARKMDNVSVTAKTVTVWVGVMAVALLATTYHSIPIPHVSLSVIWGVVALAIGGVIMMTAFVQYGVSHMPVHRSAVIALFELVAGAISQQLLTDEVMRLHEWAGGALIMVGAYLAASATAHALSKHGS